MPAVDSPQVARKAGDALILARIWGGFMALCHLGGLAGALAPFLVRTTYTSTAPVTTTFISLAHHIVALVTAVMLLIGLRKARFALLLVLVLAIARSASILSLTPLGGVVGLAFALFFMFRLWC